MSQQLSDTFREVSGRQTCAETLGRLAFIAALITIAAALAIWFGRRQRLIEQGV
jgi:hypothetical protein